MKIGFFGGSFDPPHRGHAAVAKAAAAAFDLDSVLFAPTGRQPLKPGGAQASYADRLAMVKKLAELDNRFAPSTLDEPRADGTSNYTVDALECLVQASPRAQIYSLIGADSFLDFHQWRRADRLLELSEWIVVSRPGFRLEASPGLPSNPERRDRIHLLSGVDEDVSATEIRSRLAHGDCCSGLLSLSVMEYIAERGLYGCSRQTRKDRG